MATLRELIIKISANSQSFQSEISRASRMGSDYHRTMQNGGRQSAAAARDSQRALADVNAQLVSVRNSALNMTGAFAGAFATGNLIRLADGYNSLSARVKLATQDAQDFTVAQAGLMRISQYTGSALADNSALFSRAASSLREWGYGTNDILNLTDAIATGLQVSGASAEETSSMIVQLSQALGRGVLRGQDFNSVAQSGQRIMKALSDGMGVAQKDLKAMADAGQLTTDKIVPALISQIGKLREEFDSMPNSVSAASTRVMNAFQEWVGGANKSSGATASLSSTLDGVAKNIDSVATAAGVLVAVGMARYFGRIASGAYSATAGLISATRGEVALADAQLRGTQIATARARSAVYRAQQALVAARGTDAQSAAEKRLSAAQVAVTRSIAARTAAQATLNNVTAVGSRLMSGALGLVGGVPGLLMLGAGAWYYMYQNQEQARRSAQEYASTIDEIRQKSGAMSLVDASDHYNKTQSSLSEQNRLIDEQKEKVRLIRVEIEGYQQMLANPGLTVGGYMINHLMSVEDATNGISTATENLSVEQDRLSRLQSKAQDIQNVLAGLEHRRVTLIRQQASEQNAAYQSLLRMNGQHTEFNRLLSLGNDLLSARQGNASFPFRVPDATLTDKQKDALEKSRQDRELSTLKGEAKELARLRYSADELGLTDNPSNQKSRQEYINNNLAKWRNDEANKPTKKGPKTDEEKAVDTYERLIKQQREQLALGSQNTELAKIKYQTTQGELSTLTSIQKQELARNAALIDQAEIRKKAAEYENGLIDSNANAKTANDSNLTGFGEGSRVRERMQEMISIRRDFIQKDDELRRQHQSGEIDDEFFNRAIALNKRYLDKRLSDQQMYYSSLDDQRNNWMGGLRDGFADWADEATDYATQASQGMRTAMGSAVGSITEMLNGNMSSWKDWGVGVLKIIQNVLVNMAVANAANGASSIIGTMFGIGASAMAGGAGAASANNAFSTGAYSNLTFNALGGVYDSPSLSAYSGGVYSTPQLFAFAKGAGVFGEAGPEAIMPLTRAANGSLGVRAIMPDVQSANSGGNVYVTINESGTASVSGNGDQNFAREFTQIIQREYRKLRDKDLSQGGALNRAITGRR
ncbi:phage tail tape measure protein [Pectobacterium polaris]|uniref:phage tail tape measure protein n=1 Tax=Pectobacterium polaris TaxID=2042057 RepID=UPI000D621E68|nr:phage tail tape measure protein [Pectobacterium polaris]MCU1787522.1 phage tail tape measure protein [Pectobacterium polaris]PWD55447.1 phage tail tape measure protein [Pectobacterium polaris]